MKQKIYKVLLVGLILVSGFIGSTFLIPVSAQVDLEIDQEAIGVLPGTANADAENQTAGFGYWFSQFLRIIVIVAAILVFINFILGAIKWITAGGDSGKVQEAQKQMTQSAIGIIVLAATVAVFQILMSFLGITFFSFSGGTTAANFGGGGDPDGGGVCVVGETANDGGAGGYCSGGGAAQVRCFGPGQGASGYDYNHWEPCSCVSGSELPGVDFSSC